jgi:hypothetical protein
VLLRHALDSLQCGVDCLGLYHLEQDRRDELVRSQPGVDPILSRRPGFAERAGS